MKRINEEIQLWKCWSNTKYQLESEYALSRVYCLKFLKFEVERPNVVLCCKDEEKVQ